MFYAKILFENNYIQQAAWITEDTDDDDDHSESSDDEGEGMVLDTADNEFSGKQGYDYSDLDEEPASGKDVEDETEPDMITAVCSLFFYFNNWIPLHCSVLFSWPIYIT